MAADIQVSRIELNVNEFNRSKLVAAEPVRIAFKQGGDEITYNALGDALRKLTPAQLEKKIDEFTNQAIDILRKKQPPISLFVAEGEPEREVKTFIDKPRLRDAIRKEVMDAVAMARMKAGKPSDILEKLDVKPRSKKPALTARASEILETF